MSRLLALILCSAGITVALIAGCIVLSIPLPWVLALGVAQVGIMWWRWPWAVGTFLGMTSLLIVYSNVPLLWVLVAAFGLMLQGVIPALIFAQRRLPYDMTRDVAINTFLVFGVLLNGLVSGAIVGAVGLQTGQIEARHGIVTIALIWLVHSLISLIISLPLLRLGTHYLRLNGIFGTPAALNRGINPPTITRRDTGLLVLLLGLVALIRWIINQTSSIPPQFLDVLFLLPIAVLTALRGLDGALISATGSLLVSLVFMLGADMQLQRVMAATNERVVFAGIVFELGIYYLIAMMGGRLLDVQRAERSRLRILFDLSSNLNSATETPTLVRIFAETICDATHASACIVTHYDEHTEMLVPLYSTPSTAFLPLLMTQPFALRAYPVFAQAISTRRAVVLHSNDPAPHTSTSAFWAETGFITGLLMPLCSASRVIGLVEVFDVRPERLFTPTEIQLVEAMSSQVAADLEQRRLIGELRDQTEQLSAVSQITAVLNATLNLDVVCRRIVRQMVRVVPHDWACVALRTANTHAFRIVMATGNTQVGLADDEPFELSPRTWSSVAAHDAAPQRIDLRTLPPEYAVSMRRAGLITALLLPLHRDNRWLGILVLASHAETAFPATQQHLLQMLARHMALAISNAQLYAELEQTYRAKQEAQDVLLQTERLRALGELSSGIAHDFNNLLAGILGHTQLLLADTPSSERDGLLIIEQAARDGTQMIQRIQQFARSQQATQPEMIDINVIINDVVQLTRPRWRNAGNGCGIDTKIDAHEVPWIYGSAFALREVLTNLILNAIDAMPSGGELTLRTQAEADHVLITVSDTGVGMSEETQGQIWTPFFSTKGDHGTGLGLSMAHAIIVQQHGGSISVQSTEGVGTTINLLLPVQRAERALPEETRSLGPPTEYHGRILVVENDLRVQSALMQLLESWGHQVVATESGQATLDIFDSRIDVLIADSGLTDMSVWELATQLKEHSPLLQAVLLTVWQHPSDVDQRRQIFDAVLPKPFEADAVHTVITQVLATRYTSSLPVPQGDAAWPPSKRGIAPST